MWYYFSCSYSYLQQARGFCTPTSNFHPKSVQIHFDLITFPKLRRSRMNNSCPEERPLFHLQTCLFLMVLLLTIIQLLRNQCCPSYASKRTRQLLLGGHYHRKIQRTGVTETGDYPCFEHAVGGRLLPMTHWSVRDFNFMVAGPGWLAMTICLRS